MLLMDLVKQYQEYLKAKRKSQETIRGYGLDLTQLDHYLAGKYNCPTYVTDITTEDIEGYLKMLGDEKNYAPASINRHLNSIRSFLRYAVRKGYIHFNAAEDIEQVKVVRKERQFLSKKELDTLLNAIEHPLIQIACRTMAYTGLRVSECTSLTLEDVNLEKGIIQVREGKGGKDRVVPISQSILPYLQEYLENVRPRTTSNYFFATKKTGEISQQYLNRKLHEATTKLGWKKKVTCHILRHTLASALISKNVNIVKVSKILGHADVRTTSIYTHTNMDELSEAVNLLK